MKYYIELDFKSTPNTTLYALWGNAYTQIHLALTELQAALGAGKVGVAFPEYRFDAAVQMGRLGSKLRVFADDTAILQQLNLSQHLRRYEDYVRLSAVTTVPEQVLGHVCYARVQVKSGAERAARRLIKRHPELNYETELARLQTLNAHSNLPFIHMHSLSNKQAFRLFIAKSEPCAAQTGDFGTYGLSNTATVPDF